LRNSRSGDYIKGECEKNIMATVRGRPFEKGRSSEEAAESGRKGGIASGVARRQAKELRDLTLAILEMPIKEGDIDEITSLASVKGKNITTSKAMILAQVRRAIEGDSKAFEVIRDTAGQKPIEKVEVSKPDSEIINEIEDYVKR
jgi:hypothetical protein